MRQEPSNERLRRTSKYDEPALRSGDWHSVDHDRMVPRLRLVRQATTTAVEIACIFGFLAMVLVWGFGR